MTTLTDDQRYQLLLVDAICGVGFPSVVLAQECESAGMAEYDLYNRQWQWDRKVLLACSEDQLQQLYEGLVEMREAAQMPTEPLEQIITEV